MPDSIKSWLAELGLEKYSSAFVDQEIDLSIIADLTEADLEKIGLPLGPRKKILKAIAREQTQDRPVPEATPMSLPFRGDQAERRHLTILFSDLVGSTALSQRLDPEDLRFVLRAYQDVCHSAIGRYDGFVARYMGDGVMAYYGYPRTHEDEPERAIRSGLELIEGIRKLDKRLTVHRPAQLQVRIGIATGVVVVGDIIGEGSALESAVVGDAPNLAARLQSLAEPDSIVVSSSTYELTRNQFQYTDLGEQKLKGINGTPRVWQVVSSITAESRFDTLHRSQLTEHVGRNDEIVTLLEHWARAREGVGCAVMLSGEPGVGKSRTTKMLYEKIRAQAPVSIRFQCSPHHTNSTLYPVVQYLERHFGFTESDSMENKIDKLQQVLDQTTSSQPSHLPLYKSILSLSDDAENSRDLSDHQLFNLLIDSVTNPYETQPVLLVFEDIHWIDPTSLDFLETLIERLSSLRVLVVATHRLEFVAPWQELKQVSTLHLNRLNRELVLEMIAHVAGDHSLPRATCEQIIDKTDGVPLFVEELTKAIIESRSHLAAAVGLDPGVDEQHFAIPATLQDSLMMRLDRLNGAKQVAQIASVIGREFSSELLRALYPDDMESLNNALAVLVDAQLLNMPRKPDSYIYEFKHALVQDAAYESLLKHRRIVIHQQIAETMIRKFIGITESQPELVAYHFTRSADHANAIDYWRRAGNRGIQRSSYVEASSHFRKALESLTFLPGDEARDHCELELLTSLATTLLPTRGYGSIEVKQTYARARALCESLGKTNQLVSILFGEWASGVHRDHLEDVLTLSRTTYSMIDQTSDMGLVLMCNRTLGNSLLFTGRLVEARKHLLFTSSHYNSERDSHLAFDYGLDGKTASQSHLLIAEWLSGNPQSAIAIAQDTLAYCDELEHGNSTAHALIHAGCFLSQFLNRVEDAHQHTQNLVQLAEEGGYQMFLAWARIFLGWCQSELGDAAGLPLMESGIKEAQESGSDLYQAYFLTLLAQGYAKYSHPQLAVDTMVEATNQVSRRGEVWYAAEVLRVQGVFQRQIEKDDASAELLFRQALDLARGQSAKMFELRASVNLAELWQERGEEDAAHNLLESCGVGIDDTLLK